MTGSDISPTITVIAEDVDNIEAVTENVKTALAASYPNAEFTISDAGSKMEAANKSNKTLTIKCSVEKGSDGEEVVTEVWIMEQ